MANYPVAGLETVAQFAARAKVSGPTGRCNTRKRLRHRRAPESGLGNDPNRDVTDLVSVCGRAQHARVPLRVDVRGADVERDLAALIVVRRDDRGIRAGYEDES